MYDFLNRVDAHRSVLELVNSIEWPNEPLMSLSKGSIIRWVEVNEIVQKKKLNSLLLKVSEKLFFLANRSQEQITEDYKVLSIEVNNLTDQIKSEIRGF